MNALLIVVGAWVWMLTGWLAVGIVIADLQSIWKGMPEEAARFYSRDRTTAMFVGLLGPMGLLAALIVSGGAPHGMTFGKPNHKDGAN